MMPTADEVAVAFVAAARACSIEGVTKAELMTLAAEALTSEPKSNYKVQQRLLAIRVRAYAATAIDKVFNHGRHVYISRPMIARIVGVNKASQQCYFGSLEARHKPWWSEATFETVVAAVRKARGEHHREVLPPMLANPNIVATKAAMTEAFKGDVTFDNLAKAAQGFGRPKPKEAEQLIGRAQERRKCADILAEAAANTRRLQDKLSENDS